MIQSAMIFGVLAQLALSKRVARGLVAVAFIAITGCSKPDARIVRCQKQISDQRS